MTQKKIKYSLFVLFFLVTIKLSSQSINLIRFNTDVEYSRGSGVSLIIDPNDSFAIDNQFILELSSIGGNWSNPQTLSTVNEFYTPVLNGIIPSNLIEGNYKLRVRSTNPASVVETELFNINSNTNSTITQATSLLMGSTIFFNCLDCNSTTNTFGSQNQDEGATTSSMNMAQRTLNICNYSKNTTYSIKLIDILNNNYTTINHSNGTFEMPSNLGIGTYVIEITSKKAVEQSVYSIVFLFHGNATSLGNSSSEEICVGSSVIFSVDTSNSSIGRNYMGSKYIVDFGDGSEAIELTQAQLLSNSRIEHIYLTPSCSELESSFYVHINLYSKGISNSCDEYSKNGNGASKRVNASQPPEADFVAPKTSCINTALKLTNNSIPGFYGSSGCKDDSNFFWYYKKPGEENYTFVSNTSWIDASNNLTIPASVMKNSGCWTIKL